MAMASDGTRAYGLVQVLCGLLLRVFYGRIEVVGLDRVPREGGLIVAANHNNSAVDAMLLMWLIPRRLHTLANAPLFRHPVVGPFLRLAGALPVHRRQEAGDDPTRNAGLFSATDALLQAGGAVLIFPEGRTQAKPVLLELRTGAARMLLTAQEGCGAAPALLPVGLALVDPGTFRRGRVRVRIGHPLATVDLAAADPGEDAVRGLTARLTEALRGMMGSEAPGAAPAHEKAASRPILVRRVWSDAFALLAGAPLALLGLALHGLAFGLTRAIADRISRTDEEEATDKIFAGLFAYPLVWAVEAWGALVLGGSRTAAVLGAVLLPAGVFALAWWDGLERLVREARALADCGHGRRGRE